MVALELEQGDLGLRADEADVELRLADDGDGAGDRDDGGGNPGPFDAAERAERHPVERDEDDQVNGEADDDERGGRNANAGGGAKSKFWRQMQADVLGKTVVSMVADEGPAYGVALLAAVGAGEYKNVVEACDATVKTRSQLKSSATAKRYYDNAFPVYQNLYPALRDDFKAIAQLG